MKFNSKYPLITYGKEDFDKATKTKEFIEGVNVKDHKDNMFRLTPLFAKELIKDYELVVRLDADQIIMGDFDYIVEQRKNYDLGTVLNINRVDPLHYKPCGGWGIPPNEYYNIGLIAFTSESFLNHLWKLCNSKYFWRLQYREQDLVNVMAHYGDYRVKCFDHPNIENNYCAFHGLVAKGEGLRFRLEKDGEKYKVVLPKGPDNYPDHDMVIKAYHFAGGEFEKKYNYHIHFKPDIVDYVEWLISDTGKPYENKSE